MGLRGLGRESCSSESGRRSSAAWPGAPSSLLKPEYFEVARPVQNGPVYVNTADFGESAKKVIVKAFEETSLTKPSTTKLEVIDGKILPGSGALAFVN